MADRSSAETYREWVTNHQYVRARYVTAGDNGYHGEGVVISYQSAPTVGIRRDDGTIFDWRADLCEPANRPPGPIALTMAAQPPDEELATIAQIVDLLDDAEPPERGRIIRYITSRYGED